ncbi:unnamed protein product, partial [Acidithrix sp. C25]
VIVLALPQAPVMDNSAIRRLAVALEIPTPMALGLWVSLGAL